MIDLFLYKVEMLVLYAKDFWYYRADDLDECCRR